MKNKDEFRRDLSQLINRHSLENGSDTPDFMIADYLISCLDAFEFTLNARKKWHGDRIA